MIIEVSFQLTVRVDIAWSTDRSRPLTGFCNDEPAERERGREREKEREGERQKKREGGY